MNILVSSVLDVRNSAPQRIHHFIRHLSRQHNVTVVCIKDHWKSEMVDPRYYYQNDKGQNGKIKVHYLTERKISPVYQEPLSFCLIKPVFDDEFDVLFNYNTLTSGNFLAKRLKIPMVYDMADDLPAMVAHSPQIPRIMRPYGKKLAEYLLKKNIQNSEVITCTATLFKDRYRIPDDKFVLLPNGVNSALFRIRQSGLREWLGLQGIFILGYVGVLREWVNLEPVYDALQYFNGVKLLIIGEEGRLEENKNLVKRYKVQDKVVFLGTVPHERLPEYISIMDACLVPFTKDEISQSAIPIKLFEYMACEKPVISTSLEGIRDVIEDGILYADTPQEYRTQIMRLLDGRFSEQKVLDGRKLVCNDFSWEKIAQRLEAELERCLR